MARRMQPIDHAMHIRDRHPFRRASPGAGAGETGSALVEFSLVAPMLLLTTFLIVDTGFYFFVRHTLQFATREGVRLALVGGTLSDEAGNPLSREASIISTIQRNAAVAGIDAADLQISIYPVGSDFSDPDGWEDRRDAGAGGEYMRVRTRYDHPFITPLVRHLGPEESLAVQAEATYRNELFD